jgi:ABC-type multidrug transport system ATPase subunit
MPTSDSSGTLDGADEGLVARGLGRRFGERWVLRGVDVQVRGGEVLALIGPNGGGKSTLLALMAGLLAPTEGQVTLDGRDTATLATDATGSIGLITTRPGLYPLLTGRENLHFFGGLYGLDEEEVDARTGPLLEQLGMHDHLDKPVAAGSAGMQQKISLARALLLHPKMLLLDEPTANLDPDTTARVEAWLTDLIKRHDWPVLWVAHDPQQIGRVADAHLRIAGHRLETAPCS